MDGKSEYIFTVIADYDVRLVGTAGAPIVDTAGEGHYGVSIDDSEGVEMGDGTAVFWPDAEHARMKAAGTTTTACARLS